MRKCKYCEAEFPLIETGSQRGSNRAQKFCSVACRTLAATNGKVNTRKIIARNVCSKSCKFCNNLFTTNRPKQIFCSYDCRYRSAQNRASERWALTHPKAEFYEYDCSICGIHFQHPHRLFGIAVKYGIFCKSCSVELQKARYRRKNIKRRGYIPISRLTMTELVDKFGDVCQLCDEKIDVTLPRTSKMGLTLDHIVPLSRGGSDEDSNLQAAHWICNSRKGNDFYA